MPQSAHGFFSSLKRRYVIHGKHKNESVKETFTNILHRKTNQTLRFFAYVLLKNYIAEILTFELRTILTQFEIFVSILIRLL